MIDEIDKIVVMINVQKGELMGINVFFMVMVCLLIFVEFGRFFDGFDNEIVYM